MIEIDAITVPKEYKENFTASVLDLVKESFQSIAEEADPEVAFNRTQQFVAARQGGSLTGDSYNQRINTSSDSEEPSDSYEHISSSTFTIQDSSYDQAGNQCTTYESEYCSDFLAHCVDSTLPKNEKVQPIAPKTKSSKETSKSVKRARRYVTVGPQSVVRLNKSKHLKPSIPPSQPFFQHCEDRASDGGDEELFDSLALILEELTNPPKQTKSFDSRASKRSLDVKCDSKGSGNVDCYDYEDSDLELEDFSVIQSARKVPIETVSGRRTRYSDFYPHMSRF
ncbi:uncharacterized protein MELLADRAFT_72906 [Melampsora larici-populina 98AG31]|uniref:Uncharacterized protein n=1 Tax=Melampsora larici-populina (strain 98AG31 / pathotype 3-4-7) TaxID=747676 RepID=F4S0L6_MELLP|nr:uncharacterized protein MELLADRAFT_72906 [Melampsora larici-populina 98AG31]EGG01788.1 hypothetical protein MELLADRAFT_72906 [Melampsora larici-populina 98AG31]